MLMPLEYGKMWTTEVCVFVNKHIIMSWPGKGLEQQKPNEKANKGSNRKDYHCSREDIEYFQRTISSR